MTPEENEIVLKDDAQVVELTARKLYGGRPQRPQLIVRVRTLPPPTP